MRFEKELPRFVSEVHGAFGFVFPALPLDNLLNHSAIEFVERDRLLHPDDVLLEGLRRGAPQADEGLANADVISRYLDALARQRQQADGIAGSQIVDEPARCLGRTRWYPSFMLSRSTTKRTTRPGAMPRLVAKVGVGVEMAAGDPVSRGP